MKHKIFYKYIEDSKIKLTCLNKAYHATIDFHHAEKNNLKLYKDNKLKKQHSTMNYLEAKKLFHDFIE